MIYQWAEANPEFADALVMMREHAEAYWENVGEKYHHIEKDGGKFNTPVWKHFMAVRFGQHEKQVIDTNSKTDINVVIAPPSNEPTEE